VISSTSSKVISFEAWALTRDFLRVQLAPFRRCHSLSHIDSHSHTSTLGLSLSPLSHHISQSCPNSLDRGFPSSPNPISGTWDLSRRVAKY